MITEIETHYLEYIHARVSFLLSLQDVTDKQIARLKKIRDQRSVELMMLGKELHACE